MKLPTTSKTSLESLQVKFISYLENRKPVIIYQSIFFFTTCMNFISLACKTFLCFLSPCTIFYRLQMLAGIFLVFAQPSNIKWFVPNGKFYTVNYSDERPTVFWLISNNFLTTFWWLPFKLANQVARIVGGGDLLSERERGAWHLCLS